MVFDVLCNINSVYDVDVVIVFWEVVWEDGKVKLYYFLWEDKLVIKMFVLVFYVLVNCWEMMDLQLDCSFICKLISEGLDVYLIDWGYLIKVDCYKKMEDYIFGNINDCVDYICEVYGLVKVNLFGVCQGGIFSLIYFVLFFEKIKNLVILVILVDFDNEEGLFFKWVKDMDVDVIVDGFGGIIFGDFFNIGFDLFKLMNKVCKYMVLF